MASSQKTGIQAITKHMAGTQGKKTSLMFSVFK